MAVARLFLFVSVGLLLGAASAYSQAVLLYDNGSPDFQGGYEMTEWTVADDFEVPFSAQASRVAFAMSDLSCTFPANSDGYLRWWIYLDNHALDLYEFRIFCKYCNYQYFGKWISTCKW